SVTSRQSPRTPPSGAPPAPPSPSEATGTVMSTVSFGHSAPPKPTQPVVTRGADASAMRRNSARSESWSIGGLGPSILQSPCRPPKAALRRAGERPDATKPGQPCRVPRYSELASRPSRTGDRGGRRKAAVEESPGSAGQGAG